MVIDIFCFISASFDGVLLSPRTAIPFQIANTMQNNSWNSTTSIRQTLASYLLLTDSYHKKDLKLPQSLTDVRAIGDVAVNDLIGDNSIIGKVIGDIIRGDYISGVGEDSINSSIVGDFVTVNNIIGYQQPPVVSCSSVLKKRKKKMNKHKYKKRRARDKFKRRNLENIKERKKRTREKAEERVKAALV